MDPSNIDQGKLKRLIKKHFNIEEIKSLCVDLDIEFEDIPGTTREAKARELVDFYVRTHSLDNLIEKLREERPNVNWDVIIILNPRNNGPLKVEEEHQSNQFFLSQLCELMFGKFRSVWLTYSVWLIISALGFIASLVEVFGLTCSTRFLLFLLLALIGGGIIVSCGWFSSHNPPLADWDKMLATVLWLISILLLAYFSRQCPSASPYIIKIVNQAGVPIPNARVSLQSGTVQFPDAISDVNGISRFFIDDVLDGAAAQVVVSISGCGVQTININIDKSQQVPHTIQSNCTPQTLTATSTLFTTTLKTDTPTPETTPISTNTSTPTSTPTPPDSCTIEAIQFSRDGGQLLSGNNNLQLSTNQETQITARVESLPGCSVFVIWERTGGQFLSVGGQQCNNQVCSSSPNRTYPQQGKEFSEFEARYKASDQAGTYFISLTIKASSTRANESTKIDQIIVEVR